MINLLSQKINKTDIKKIIAFVLKNEENREMLYESTKSSDDRIGLNALWCMTHLPNSEAEWLQSKQNMLIDQLLNESNRAKKRLLLQLLRGQEYDINTLRTDFIDYCLCKINSQSEPYAVRCFSIYCAFKMCRFFPELIAELKEHLNLLETQILSPGLQCALRTTRKNIAAL